MEMKKYDEDLLKFCEEQKMEKEAALRKVVELENQLLIKQNIEREIEELKEELLLMKLKVDEYEARENIVEQLKEELKEKTEEIEGLEALNQCLLIAQRQNNDELQDALKELRIGLLGRVAKNSPIAFKRLGELDEKPFSIVCKEKFSKQDAEFKAAMLYSQWQNELTDPHWHPFKVNLVKGKEKEVLLEDDEKLKSLKNEYGDEVFKAVTTALLELNEYNPSQRTAVSVFWNTMEGRKATLKEVIKFIFQQWRTPKLKR